ncbi:MAG TPA: hypothetical protein VGV68_07670 [Terriglobia bacterium]|nr:hypothetical protein [Terriglobia bacterium]
MQKPFVKSMLFAAAVAVFSSGVASASLWSHKKSGVESARVDLSGNTKLGNGPELKPGNYRVELLTTSPTPEVSFYRDNKLVAQTPVKLVSESKKNNETAIYTKPGENNSQIITEIELNGTNQKIVIPHAGS